ncbi:unnamed protein product [Ixodes pacificus]
MPAREAVGSRQWLLSFRQILMMGYLRHCHNGTTLVDFQRKHEAILSKKKATRHGSQSPTSAERSTHTLRFSSQICNTHNVP